MFVAFSNTMKFEWNEPMKNEKIIKTLAIICLFGFQSLLAQVPIYEWAKQIHASSKSIAVDSSGNLYAFGEFSGTVDFDPGAGVSNLTAVGYKDGFIQKLDPDGNLLWIKQIAGSYNVLGKLISIDSDGNIYTIGNFEGTADFDPGDGSANLTTDGSYPDVFVQKLNINGDFVWVKQIGGTGQDFGQSLSVDTLGNVYFTGFFGETADFDPGTDTFNITSLGGMDVFVEKLDSNGDFLWAKQMGGAVSDYSNSIALDVAGNVYTLGRFNETVDFDPGIETANLISEGNPDIFIQKMNANGDFLWVKQIEASGSFSHKEGNSIAIDPLGNIYATGYYSFQVDFDPGPGVFNQTTVLGSEEIFVLKLDGNGDFLWVKIMGGADDSRGNSIAVDSSGNSYTTGYFGGTAYFPMQWPPFSFNSLGHQDIFVQKLDADGNGLWVQQMGGGTDLYYGEQGFSIAVDLNQNVYTTGVFQEAADFDPGEGTDSLIAVYRDSFVQKLGQCFPTAPAPDIITLPDLSDECSVTAADNPTAHTECTATIVGTTSTNFPFSFQGTYAITWKYDDGYGTISTQVQNIIIDDVSYPVPDVDSLSDINKCVSATIPAPTATDNCTGVVTGVTETTFPITEEGLTVITWTYDDGHGNVVTQNQNVFIGDVTDPVPDIDNLPDLTASCEITASDIPVPVATDNCAGAMEGAANVSFPITAQGTTVITWTYDDGNGNVLTQNQNVTIADVTHPLPDVFDLPDVFAMCEITDLDAPSASDNCAGPLIATPNLSFPIDYESVAQIIWTYDDGNGNLLSQIQAINWISLDVSTSVNDHTIIANNANGTYQWMDCDNNYEPLPGETNQSLTATANGNYAVEITENGCVATSECVSITTVGVTEIEKDIPFLVYPNPSTNIFTVEFVEPISDAVIKVSDSRGRLISSTKIQNGVKADIEVNEAPGIYILTIRSKEWLRNIQLVKE